LCRGARIDEGANNLAKLNNVEIVHLDLADPASVDRFADKVIKSHDVTDLLINNAGIMRPTTLTRNSRGHELQFATNHLGHFQLTARLWPAIKNAQGAQARASFRIRSPCSPRRMQPRSTDVPLVVGPTPSA
jgi:NAD(P)-dependent dehydrogenase (short-subunit alcohol dehydrogenase family)